MFSPPNIRTRLSLLLVVVGLIPLTVVSLVMLERARTALYVQAFEHLQNISHTKKIQLERHIERIRADITVLAGSAHLVDAIDAFASIVDNGEMNRVEYNYFESLEYGNSFRKFIAEYGYYDLMLVTPDGDIVYSIRQESDLAQNLQSGTLANTQLGQALEPGLKEITVTDFELYAPSNDQLMAFLLAPVQLRGEETMGAVVLKMTHEQINRIMLERTGMGQSGEAYLVGPDRVMRSDSYLDPEHRKVLAAFRHPDQGRVDTVSTSEALAGRTGKLIQDDYRGVSVLVEMMGGEVGVESEYGKGSTFWFTARFGLGAKPKARAQRVLPEELQDLRVLVVDDHPTARTILARYLESFGFSTGEAASGAEALDELETTELPYQLVLIDWHMPGMDGIEATRRIHGSGRITSHPDIIMVSAYGREEVVEQAEAEGIKGFLVKPVSPSSLYDAILEAMGHGVERVSQAVGAVPAQEQLRGARVLLAEDNEINQQVADELLRQAGLQVTVANHGREGVAMLAARPENFDGVLMDIQMPVLGGYAATGEIRKDARFQALPIIAMTANAMAGDRDKALDAGMNDHVAKPIDVAELFEVLGRWLQVPEGRRSSAPQTLEGLEAVSDEVASLPALAGVDAQSGLARVGGKVAVYRKILRQFANSQADASARIRSALESGDRATAEREAHTLKGVAENIGADEVQAAAKRLEAAIREGADSEPLIAALEGILDKLVDSLASLTAAPATAGEAPVAGTTLDLLPQLDRLQALLEDYDSAAGDLVSELGSQAANAESAQEIQAIGERIDDFEYDEALERLNALRDYVTS